MASLSTCTMLKWVWSSGKSDKYMYMCMYMYMHAIVYSHVHVHGFVVACGCQGRGHYMSALYFISSYSKRSHGERFASTSFSLSLPSSSSSFTLFLSVLPLYPPTPPFLSPSLPLCSPSLPTYSSRTSLPPFLPPCTVVSQIEHYKTHRKYTCPSGGSCSPVVTYTYMYTCTCTCK